MKIHSPSLAIRSVTHGLMASTMSQQRSQQCENSLPGSSSVTNRLKWCENETLRAVLYAADKIVIELR